MNNKEFINKLSAKSNNSQSETQRLTDLLLKALKKELKDGNIVSVQGFGTFEVKKKMERIVVNPSTKQKMLVPPKLVLAFKPSNGLKEKIK